MTMLMGERRPNFNWEQSMKWWKAHSDGSHSPVSDEENLEHWEDIDSYNDRDVLALYDVASFDAVQRVIQLGLFFNHDTEKKKKVPTLFESSEEDIVPTLSESSEEDIPYWLAGLAELQELAEYVDITQELHSCNYLAPFFQKVLSYKYKAGIYNKHAAVRIKAAEVVTTMVHNNPTNQQLVMEANGLQHLLDNFISDTDVTSRTKALVAISSLIRNNKPAITKFLLDNGYAAALRNALISESVTLQREALNLIQYLLHENSSDCNIVTQSGVCHFMMHLTSSVDAQVREAALRGLLVLATNDGGQALLMLALDKGDQLVRNHDQLKKILQERINRIRAMPLEDLSAVREEIQLVDSLWNTLYNEPSSLRDVLPGVTRLLTT